MPIIWNPKALTDNSWPASLHLQAGTTTGLNQIINEINRISAFTGFAPLPLVVVNSTQINKAFFKTIVERVNLFTNGSLAVPPRIGPSFIKQLRDALTGFASISSGISVSRTYIGTPPQYTYIDPNSYVDLVESSDLLMIQGQPTNPYVRRTFYEVLVQNNTDLKMDLKLSTGWYYIFDATQKQPFVPSFTVKMIKSTLANVGSTFNMADAWTSIGTFNFYDYTIQTDANGSIAVGVLNTFSLGNYAPGNYVFSVCMDDDTTYALLYRQYDPTGDDRWLADASNSINFYAA